MIFAKLLKHNHNHFPNLTKLHFLNLDPGFCGLTWPKMGHSPALCIQFLRRPTQLKNIKNLYFQWRVQPRFSMVGIQGIPYLCNLDRYHGARLNLWLNLWLPGKGLYLLFLAQKYLYTICRIETLVSGGKSLNENVFFQNIIEKSKSSTKSPSNSWSGISYGWVVQQSWKY